MAIDWAPVIYAVLTALFTIAILALRGAVLESNKTHKAEELNNDHEA
jgi:hypothetical protein